MKHVEVRGERVPAIGLGTWQLSGRDCRRAVETALELGYRHIDTAQLYANEEDIGRVLSSSGHREEIFLTTKLDTAARRPGNVVAATEESLRKLATDHVDLLLIHWPGDRDELPFTLEAMRTLVDAGKVRHIGVSNFPSALFAEAAEHADLFCNQVEYHPFLAQDAVLAMARKHGAFVAAYSPLARGRVFHEPVLVEIGERHGKTPGQVTLRWLIEQEGVAAIPKATSRDHLAANLDVLDFSLSDEEHDRIRALERNGRLVDPPAAPDWD